MLSTLRIFLDTNRQARTPATTPRSRSFPPPSALPGISPKKGGDQAVICPSTNHHRRQHRRAVPRFAAGYAPPATRLISLLVGEMAGRPEGGAKDHDSDDFPWPSVRWDGHGMDPRVSALASLLLRPRMTKVLGLAASCRRQRLAGHVKFPYCRLAPEAPRLVAERVRHALTLATCRELPCLRHPRAEQERSELRRPGDPCRDLATAAAVQNVFKAKRSMSPSVTNPRG